jgi:uncharacterized phage protein (TIGR02218 family)
MFDKGTVEIKLKQRFSAFDSEIPRKTYSQFCPHHLGDEYCTVNLSTYSITIPYEEFVISGTKITSDYLRGYASDYFLYGYVKANTGEAVWILNYDSTNGVATLVTEFFSADDITSIEVIPGCDKTINNCSDKFSNTDNFGGYPYIPDRNPTTEGFR